MQDEINLLNEKLDYLTEGSRRLDGLYNKSLEETRNLKTQLNTCKNQNGAIFATQSSNQDCQRIIEGNYHTCIIWYFCSGHTNGVTQTDEVQNDSSFFGPKFGPETII